MINTTATSQIEKLNHNGSGITHVNGKVVFVDQVLPDEVVTFEQTKHLAKFDRARVVEVVSASPSRVAPPCPHYDECGGCSLQHLAPPEQIKFKQQVVAELLAHQLKLEPSALTFEAPITGPTSGYRRKARLGVKYLKGKDRLIIGFHEKRGRYLADINSCYVLEPAVGTKIEALRHLLRSLSVYDAICQLEIAVVENTNIVVIRHLRALSKEDVRLLLAAGRELNLVFYSQIGGYDTLKPLESEGVLPSFQLNCLGPIQLFFQPTGFIQINAVINAKLVAKVLAWLEPKAGETIIDFYCGIGNFSLPIAKSGASVLGLEGEASAVKMANFNAEYNYLASKASFKVMDLNEPDMTELEGFIIKHSVSKIVLDPPRTGALALLTTLVKAPLAQPLQQIIYVSCNPATLARDSAYLCENGYTIKHLLVADMYPHTAHVETTACFVKQDE